MKSVVWIAMLGVFWVVFSVYWLSPVATSMDSALSVYFAASLVKTGDLKLDEYRYLVNPFDYRIDNIGGHLYSHYPIGAPLMASPFFAIADHVFTINGVRPSEFIAASTPNEATWQIEKMLASTIVALTALVIFAIALEFLGFFKSLITVLIFAFATSAWSTASRALWQHGPSMLCLSFALYLLLTARRKPRLAILSALPLAFSYVARPTNGLAIAILTVYVFLEYRKYFIFYLLGLLVVFIPFAIYSYSIYSQLTPPYYSPESILVTPSAGAMLKNLFSPSRGLFVFSPILLFSLFGMYISIRRSIRGRKLHIDIFLLAIIILHWITISANSMWYAGWSIGPRLFSDMTPFLIYFFIPLFQELPAPPVHPTAYSMALLVFITFAVFSVFVQFRCSTDTGPILWNGIPQEIGQDEARLTDWSDIQFLRGLCTNGDYRAPACWFKSTQIP